jgi:hypothetical protein
VIAREAVTHEVLVRGHQPELRLVPEVQHRRLRAWPAASKTGSPQPSSEVLVLSTPVLEAQIEAVDTLEIRPPHAETESVRLVGSGELRLVGPPRPPAVSEWEEDARPPVLPIRPDELPRRPEQPACCGPAPDGKPLVEHAARQRSTQEEPLARDEPAGEHYTADCCEEGRSGNRVTVEEDDVPPRRSKCPEVQYP